MSPVRIVRLPKHHDVALDELAVRDGVHRRSDHFTIVLWDAHLVEPPIDMPPRCPLATTTS
jgi:hypothetical protein